MLSLFERIKTWWTVADPKQKVVTLGGIGALILLLVGTAFFATRPRYATLLEGMSDLERGGVVEALKAQQVPYQLGPNGSIEVPEAQVDAARMGLATAGKLPKGGDHWSKNDLTKANAFMSPEVEKQTLNTVREDEIARALETMEGVATANVLITQPKESAFAEDKTRPTASVTLVEDGRGTLTQANGRTIANLVCSAVDGMRPEDVTVVSNSLGELWNGKNGDTTGNKADLDAKVGHYWEGQIQSALDVPFGAGNTKVIVRADVDTAQRSFDEHDVTPSNKPTSIATTQEEMQGGKGNAGGPAGSTSNTTVRANAEPPKEGDGKGSYQGKIKQAEYTPSTKDSHVQGGEGDLKGLAITVIANSAAVTEEAKVKTIVDGLLGGLIKHDATGAVLPDQAFSTTVTSVPFDGTAAKAAKDAADRVAGQQRTQQILSLLPIAAILFVALLVAKQVGKISKAVLPAPPEVEGTLAEEPEALPNAEGVEALPAPVLDEHGNLVTALEEPSYTLTPIRERVDVPLETLKQMASERPEMLATLIKSVMLGERG